MPPKKSLFVNFVWTREATLEYLPLSGALDKNQEKLASTKNSSVIACEEGSENFVSKYASTKLIDEINWPVILLLCFFPITSFYFAFSSDLFESSLLSDRPQQISILLPLHRYGINTQLDFEEHSSRAFLFLIRMRAASVGNRVCIVHKKRRQNSS